MKPSQQDMYTSAADQVTEVMTGAVTFFGIHVWKYEVKYITKRMIKNKGTSKTASCNLCKTQIERQVVPYWWLSGKVIEVAGTSAENIPNSDKAAYCETALFTILPNAGKLPWTSSASLTPSQPHQDVFWRIGIRGGGGRVFSWEGLRQKV